MECEECGKSVEGGGPFCPHCEYPLPLDLDKAVERSLRHIVVKKKRIRIDGHVVISDRCFLCNQPAEHSRLFRFRTTMPRRGNYLVDAGFCDRHWSIRVAAQACGIAAMVLAAAALAVAEFRLVSVPSQVRGVLGGISFFGVLILGVFYSGVTNSLQMSRYRKRWLELRGPCKPFLVTLEDRIRKAGLDPNREL